MTSIHCAPLFAAILLLIPTVLAQSVPSAAVGQAILDQPLVGDVALPVLGGQLTNGVDMVFANSGDKAPNTVNTGAVSIGFTTATVLPVGGQVVVTLPKGYFTAVDSSKINSFSGTSTTCKCTLATGSSTDSVTCTTAGAALAIGAATLSFSAGTVTTGAPTAAGPYNVQTSVDRAMSSAPFTKALGGIIAAVVDMSTTGFATAADKVPGTVNTGTVKIGFTVATAIPVGGQVTLIFPKNYFSAVSSTAVNTFDSTKVTATCNLVKASGAETKDHIICSTAGDSLAAAAQTLTLVAGAVTTGAATAAGTFTIKTSTDRESATAATVQLGGALTNAVDVVFATAADKVPGTVNAGNITLGFTTVTALPIGGTITIALPPKYFTAVDSSKINTFTTAGAAVTTTAKCVLISGSVGTSVFGISNADTVVCTTSVAALAVGAQVIAFVAGAVTSGIPQAAATFSVATSVDAALGTAGNTVALGGQLGSGVAIAFTAAGDQVPGTLSTNTTTLGFTTVTALPIGGKITLAMPSGYFSFVDTNKANTLTGGGTAKCGLTAGVTGTSVLGISSADTIICTVAGTGLDAATAITLTFIAGAVKTGTPQDASTFNVATSVDIQLATAPATLALGGAVGSGVAMSFTTATNKHPFTLSTDTVTLGFTAATAIPIGGKVIISVPRGYFSKVDESKSNTLTTSNAVCTCALTQATGVSTQDTITCTTSGAIVAASVAQTLTFVAGAITTGAATTAGTFDIATSVDRKLTGTATEALGGQLTTAVALAFTNADDRIPGKFSSNNNTITLGFTVATVIPIGGKITITLPQGYFSKVDSTKDNTVGTSANAKCALINVAQTPAAVSISPATTTAGSTSTLTVNLVASVVTGLTQVAFPLAGFTLDAASVATCTANCASNTAGKVTAVIANGVLTLTLATDNSISLKNTLTTFTITSVTNPASAGWPTTGINGVAFNPSTTVVCTTAGSVIAAAAQVFTFVAGAVTVGSGQKASTFQVETSTDRALATAGATVSIGGGLTVGRPLAFANPQDQVPGQVNSGPISLGASLENSVPVGGQFLLTFPTNYFTNVNPASVVTLTRGSRRSLLQQSTLSCVRIAGNPADQIVCTLAGAASGTGPVVLTFPPGSLTTGLPVFVPGGPTGFNIATANPPVPVVRVPYFPKASATFNAVAVLLFSLSALLALL